MSAVAVTVSDVTALVRDSIAARPELEDVLVEGEVSNVSTPASGHVYFTLKDSRAALACVCFRTHAQRIPFRVENGMTLLAHGSVQVYEQQGRYQLNADRLEPSGIGALALAVEQLKRRLAAEGLFDARRKRELPLLPRRVVVVTSRSGAALRDVHTVMTRRAPGIDLVLSPATVQGEGAADTIVTALRRAGQVRGADVILLVRGGGAIEDLMPFNSEAVARAIAAATLPVVSGIGHETDTTVADHAADRRAATPSAAAELVVPSVAELRQGLSGRSLRMVQAVQGMTAQRRSGLEHREARLGRLSPGHRVAGLRQDLDRRTQLLRRALLAEVAAQRRTLDAASGRLGVQHPSRRLEVGRSRLERHMGRLEGVWRRGVDARRASLATRSAQVEALSPRRTLERGYSITLDAGGTVLTSSAGVRAQQRVRTLLGGGAFESVVVDVDAVPPGDERMYDEPRHDG